MPCDGKEDSDHKLVTAPCADGDVKIGLGEREIDKDCDD